MEIGVAVGRGTGSELAGVFINALNRLAGHFSLQVKVHQSSRTYHSYQSLVSDGHDLRYICDETNLDARHYENFCRTCVAQGIKVIFRTAFTAQSLYLVRQHLKAVKVEFYCRPPDEMILIRDQAQGFYTGSNTYSPGALAVARTSHFEKIIFSNIVDFAFAVAGRRWGEKANIESVTLVYKHHLFDGIFDVWAQEWSKTYGVQIRFVQPDTMNRNMLVFGSRGRQLIIASNEYADIMQVLLINNFGHGVQETSYARNVYLSPDTDRLVEYQTVHGSADDLEGKGVVNPTATLKAAAAILEHYGLCKDMELAMARAIEAMTRWRICTPDQGGTATTATYVKAVLDYLISQPNAFSLLERTPIPHLPTLGLKTAFLVIDFQKDFAASMHTSSPPLATLTSNITHVLSRIRYAQTQAPPSSSTFPDMSASTSTSFTLLQDIEIIHVRFLGDPSYQPAPWSHHNTTSHLPKKCLTGQPGANYVTPAAGPQGNELVFTKMALFDPFLLPDFETCLRKSGIQHLVLVGLYGDVCLDATARSGFQRGFWISVVKGCVGTLRTRLDEWEAFVKEVYGARVLEVEALVGKAPDG